MNLPALLTLLIDGTPRHVWLFVACAHEVRLAVADLYLLKDHTLSALCVCFSVCSLQKGMSVKGRSSKPGTKVHLEEYKSPKNVLLAATRAGAQGFLRCFFFHMN